MDIDYIKKGYLLVHLNDLIEIFQKMVVNRLWSYRLWDVKGRINSKTTESVKEPTSFIFKGWHLANDTSEPNLSHVLRNKWGLSDALKYFAQLLLVFLLVSAGNTANEPFATF